MLYKAGVRDLALQRERGLGLKKKMTLTFQAIQIIPKDFLFIPISVINQVHF